MEGFFTWCVRNPAILLASIAIAGGATAVIEWGLALSSVCVLAFFAYVANFLASRAKDRREVREAEELKRIERERQAVKGKFANWLNQNDDRQDLVA